MPIPKFLSQGDKVAIVATAKRMEYDFQSALDTLKHWGLNPILGKSAHEFDGYFAGTDAQKIEDFNWAINDPEIKGIIFLRGGYGTSRIIDQIDFSKFQSNPKWMVGYSDLTTMILQMDHFDIPMIHGPMCYTLGKHGMSDEILREVLFGKTSSNYACRTIKAGSATGRIVGGNLSMIYESIGAQNEIQADNNILFLEDVGEQMYGIDRMMNKLKRVGKLENISGLVLGSFTSIGNQNDYFSQSVEDLILSYVNTEVPVAISLNAGHDEENLALVMNRNCELETAKNRLIINYL